MELPVYLLILLMGCLLRTRNRPWGDTCRKAHIYTHVGGSPVTFPPSSSAHPFSLAYRLCRVEDEANDFAFCAIRYRRCC
jgi:hypothetical protein